MTLHEIISSSLAENLSQPHTVIDNGIMKLALKPRESIDRAAVLGALADHDGVHCLCDFLDGAEHSYMEIGAWVGDQHGALGLMSLLEHLGVGEVLHPAKVMPQLGAEMHARMIGAGYVTFKAYPVMR